MKPSHKMPQTQNKEKMIEAAKAILLHYTFTVQMRWFRLSVQRIQAICFFLLKYIAMSCKQETLSYQRNTSLNSNFVTKFTEPSHFRSVGCGSRKQEDKCVHLLYGEAANAREVQVTTHPVQSYRTSSSMLQYGYGKSHARKQKKHKKKIKNRRHKSCCSFP